MPPRDESDFDREIERLGIRFRDADQLKVRQDVFDEVTLLALYRLANRGLITAVGGSISTGKEGNVFYGEGEEGALAIKIYRIRTANFRAMSEYLIGDRRFSNIRRSRKEIIFAWTRKEFSNLRRAQEAGIPVPAPFAFDRNILLMAFLGEEERPYPPLRQAPPDDPSGVYEQITGYIERLYTDARLVHADLSEYNILMGDRPYIIDMGQAVTAEHPRAREFLLRDIKIINRFFSDRCKTEDERILMDRIIGGGR